MITDGTCPAVQFTDFITELGDGYLRPGMRAFLVKAHRMADNTTCLVTFNVQAFDMMNRMFEDMYDVDCNPQWTSHPKFNEAEPWCVSVEIPFDEVERYLHPVSDAALRMYFQYQKENPDASYVEWLEIKLSSS